MIWENKQSPGQLRSEVIMCNKMFEKLTEIRKTLSSKDWNPRPGCSNEDVESFYKKIYKDLTLPNNGTGKVKKSKKPISPNVTVKIPTELGSVCRSITSSQMFLKKMLEFLAKADTRLWNPAFEKMDNEEIKMTRDEVGAYLDDMKDLLTQYDKMSAVVKEMLRKINVKAKELNKDGSLTFKIPREELEKTEDE